VRPGDVRRVDEAERLGDLEAGARLGGAARGDPVEVLRSLPTRRAPSARFKAAPAAARRSWSASERSSRAIRASSGRTPRTATSARS
jgi:hypothetical protein